MGDARRWLFYAAIVAHVLAVSVAIDHVDPVVAWAVGAAGAFGLGVFGLRMGRA
jgi:hypothetical protein